MLLMGLDIGTTSVKAAVFGENAEPVSFCSRAIPISGSRPGCAEQDAESVFDALLGAMGEAAARCGRDIGSVSLSVQGDAVMPLGRDMRPLAPMQLGMDYRSAGQARLFADEFGARALFERTGMAPHPMNALCKIRWMTESNPRVAAKTHRYMTYADYALYRLGADEPAIDYGMASRTMGMRLAARDWDDELLAAAGISRAQLSRPIKAGSPVGRLRRDICDALSISPSALLAAGAHDQSAAAAGAGIAPGMALDSHGSAEAISAVLAGPKLDGRMFGAGFPCYFHADAERYFTFSLNHAAGLLLKWFAEELCGAPAPPAQAAAQPLSRPMPQSVPQPSQPARGGGGSPDYARIVAGLSADPSPLLALPYFNGRGTPANDLSMRGMIAGLTLSSTRSDIARAILESLAFDMRVNIGAMREAGIPIDRLRCAGGGARGEFSPQLKADICRVPVETLKVGEAACLGAAMLAGVAAGVYSSPSEAACLAKPGRTYEPRGAVREHYEKRFRQYAALCDASADILRSL
ncbi:MAG: hypothetical protein LBL83_02110 [Clostridiales bacterium]|jgi:xylulokinase|nr:hypothetical protein [Clostridiales bacterium]